MSKSAKAEARRALARVDRLRAQLREAEAALVPVKLKLQDETRTIILSEPVLRRLAA